MPLAMVQYKTLIIVSLKLKDYRVINTFPVSIFYQLIKKNKLNRETTPIVCGFCLAAIIFNFMYCNIAFVCIKRTR